MVPLSLLPPARLSFPTDCLPSAWLARCREQRMTDLSVGKCKKRYGIFKQHYMASLRLKAFFPFHLIDAMGTLAETQEAITTELRYQSLLDLSQDTYQAIRHLPLAKDLVQHARQQLVNRLDDHCEKHPVLFQKVRRRWRCKWG